MTWGKGFQFCGFHRLKYKIAWMLMTQDSFGEGNGNPLQYPCLENSVDRGAWWAAVHGVAQSQTQLKQLNMHAGIEEGNGNPLQYSCLKNPREEKPGGLPSMRSQSRTWLKWLSSTSSKIALCGLFICLFIVETKEYSPSFSYDTKEYLYPSDYLSNKYLSTIMC